MTSGFIVLIGLVIGWLAAAGERTLLKIEMHVDARLMSRLWCDHDGIVYRSQPQNGGLELRLQQMRMIGGDIFWPPESATK